MLIIHIISALPIGGAERSLFNLVSSDSKSQNSHIVISLSDMGYFGRKISDLGVPVIPLGVKSIFLSFLRLPELYRLISINKPDIIQGWMYQGNIVAWLCKTFFNPKAALIWGIRHTLYDIKKEKNMIRLFIFASKLLSKYPNIIVYNSRVSLKQHSAYNFYNNKSIVIDNGFDTNKFYPSESSKKLIRKRLNIIDDKLIFANFSRFHPMKNHKQFINVALRLLKNNNFHFLLVGKDVDNNNLELISLIPSKYLKSFSFLGARGDVDDLMKATDILCITSSWGEGFPNVLGESMASGVYCIATDVGDSRYIVGDLGIIVPADNEQALYIAMEEASNMSDQERNVIGKKSREKIIDDFSINAMVDSFLNLYTKIRMRG